MMLANSTIRKVGAASCRSTLSGRAWMGSQSTRWFSASVPTDSEGETPPPTDDVPPPPPPPKAPPVEAPITSNELIESLKPSEIVSSLNRHIVGQQDAKKAVAIAMRNRWRRRQLPEDIRKEVTPRNVLLVGPTGKSHICL